jgi:hypothetical protein
MKPTTGRSVNERSEWGAVGELVGLWWRGHLAAHRAHVTPITKITRTQIVVDGYRFSRETGRCIGGGNDAPELRLPESPDIQDALAVAALTVMRWELDKARKNLRITTRSGVVAQLREDVRAALALADRLGVRRDHIL